MFCVHDSPLINVQGDSFSFYRRIPISVDGDLSLVLIMIYDEKPLILHKNIPVQKQNAFTVMQ